MSAPECGVSPRSDQRNTPLRLALDLGGRLGWALGKTVVDLRVGSVDLAHARHSQACPEGDRFYSLERFLTFIVQQKDGWVGEIAYEKAFQKGGEAARVYGGYEGVLLAFCAHNGVKVHAPHSSTVKQAFVGRGDAAKVSVLVAARVTWPGLKIPDFDEADALAVWYTVWGDGYVTDDLALARVAARELAVTRRAKRKGERK